MNDASPSRRGASMTDREPAPMLRSQRPQASDHSCGKPLGPAQAVQSLSHATTRRMIGARRSANGESRLGRYVLPMIPLPEPSIQMRFRRGFPRMR
jgi:hypothetical protein